MGSTQKNSKAGKLTVIPGVGAATAKKLVDAKLDSVSKVATAGAAKLVKAGIQAALAKKIAAAVVFFVVLEAPSNFLAAAAIFLASAA